MDETYEDFHHRLEQEKDDDFDDWEDEEDSNAVSAKVLQREMRIRGWQFCMACQKLYLSWLTIKARLDFYRVYINMEGQFWRRVRFSDEVHFTLRPRGKVRLLRKRGDQYYKNYIMPIHKRTKQDQEEFPSIHA